MLNQAKVQFAVMLAATVIVPGLLDYALSTAGYDNLGGIVWTVGYGFGIIAIWYVWIRPLDLTGGVDINP